MRLCDRDLELVDTQESDAQISSLIDDERDLRFLTETRRYPPGMPREMIFRIEAEGRLAGELRLKSIRWFNRKAEVSIFIAAEFRGRGLGQRALKLLIDYAFRQMNLHRLEAEVVAVNDAGIRLIESAGFIREGVLREAKFVDGQYVDLIRFGLLNH